MSGRIQPIPKLMVAALALMVAPSAFAEIQNLTGMPLYPNLEKAAMDPWFRTDTLGHWCSHLSAETADPVAKVEAWYRKTWLGSSTTDLTHDRDYNRSTALTGVKLAWGIDSVAVYKVSAAAPTSILLSRCSH